MYPGFPAEGIEFLRKLARNNRREWFQPLKEIFEAKVKQPMIELVEAINAELLKFAPEHINDPKKAIYRIYRDTRFSSDKTPYKTNIGAIFPRRGSDREASAGFYFQLDAKEVGIAGGMYMPTPPQLLAVRTWIAENHVEFRKMVKSAEKLAGKFHGESLTRIPKGFPADHPAADLIKMKRWVHWITLDVKVATTPKVVAEITKRFRAMAPVIATLNTIAGAKTPKARAAIDF